MGPVQAFKRACQDQCLRKVSPFDEVVRRDQIFGWKGGLVTLRQRGGGAVCASAGLTCIREGESGHQRTFRGGLKGLWIVVAFQNPNSDQFVP